MWLHCCESESCHYCSWELHKTALISDTNQSLNLVMMTRLNMLMLLTTIRRLLAKHTVTSVINNSDFYYPASWFIIIILACGTLYLNIAYIIDRIVSWILRNLFAFWLWLEELDLFEYLDDDDPELTPPLLTLLLLLRPLLRHELLRPDNTGLGMDSGPALPPLVTDPDLELVCLSLFLCLVWSCLSHSDNDAEATGLERGMETPRPGTPDTPVHRVWLVSIASSVEDTVTGVCSPWHWPDTTLLECAGVTALVWPLTWSRSHWAQLCSGSQPPVRTACSTAVSCAHRACAPLLLWPLLCDEQQHMM